jgi:ADP-ribosylglycohydrolase
MPHFEDLKGLAEEVCAWADLRHEQGLPVEAVLARMRRELRHARKDLAGREPTAQHLEREPNRLARIQALRPRGPRRLAHGVPRDYARRVKGAWLGRAAGCTLGVPVEQWSVEKMAALAKRNGDVFPPTDYWRDHPEPDLLRYGTNTVQQYLRGGITAVPVDDDLTYTVLGLLILEKFGAAFTTEDVGAAWLKWLPAACTAEHVALENLKAGVPARRAAERGNPYQEWIGADIRSDPWGYAAPGWPERAAAMAYRDAYLSHRQNGIYGAMYFAAAISAAFVVDDPMAALRIGLTEIPRTSRLARDLKWALRAAPKLRNWRAARAAVDRRFKGMHPVHTNNNACLTVFGLSLGRGDFTRTIGMTVAMGLDNDCTAATAGSLLGAVLGIDGVPEHWWKPFRNRAQTYLRRHGAVKNADLVARFGRMAKRVHEG